jgi:hypothetical protein
MAQRDIGSSHAVAGFFPGIVLRAREGRTIPFQQMEIDVALIDDGNLVIGECKTNGAELTSEEVERYLKIAALMKCRQVIFSALDGFTGIDENTRGAIDNDPMSVELLTGKELFDQYPTRALLEKREEKPVSHRENFAKALENHLSWLKDKSRTEE